MVSLAVRCLQLEPKDLAEQLKRGGAAIPAIRPGRQTAEYVTSTLTRMSILGSVFLGEPPHPTPVQQAALPAPMPG